MPVGKLVLKLVACCLYHIIRISSHILPCSTHFLSLSCLIPPFSLFILLRSTHCCFLSLFCFVPPVPIFSPYSASFPPVFSLYSALLFNLFPFSLPVLSLYSALFHPFQFFLYILSPSSICFLSLFCFFPTIFSPYSTFFNLLSPPILPHSPIFSLYSASFHPFLFSLFILLHSTHSCFFSPFCLFLPCFLSLFCFIPAIPVFSLYIASFHPFLFFSPYSVSSLHLFSLLKLLLSNHFLFPYSTSLSPISLPILPHSPHFLSLICFVPPVLVHYIGQSCEKGKM